MYYQVFAETEWLREYGFYTAYGIAAVRAGRVILTIRDVSTEEEKVRRLVQRFNEEGLALNHLDQAIEEFLYDFEV